MRLLVTLLAVVSAAQADVITTNFADGQGFGFGHQVGAIDGVGPGWAVRFTPSGDFTVTSAEIGVSQAPCQPLVPCPHTLTVAIAADLAGLPGSILLDLTEREPLSLAAGIIDFDGNVAVKGGSTYWLEVTSPSIYTGADWYASWTDNESYAGIWPGRWDSWVPIEAGHGTPMFGVYGDPAITTAHLIHNPEPSTFILMLSGVAYAVVRRRRS